MKPLLPAAALLMGIAGSTCAHAQTTHQSHRLTVSFETGAATGAVMVSLFDGEASYTSRVPIRRARVDVGAGEKAITFEGLRPGTYAVSAFHDVNGDGKMNTNPFGLPAEPYAFSNNARGNMGPASWDRAQFGVAGDTVQTIGLR